MFIRDLLTGHLTKNEANDVLLLHIPDKSEPIVSIRSKTECEKANFIYTQTENYNAEELPTTDTNPIIISLYEELTYRKYIKQGHFNYPNADYGYGFSMQAFYAGINQKKRILYQTVYKIPNNRKSLQLLANCYGLVVKLRKFYTNIGIVFSVRKLYNNQSYFYIVYISSFANILNDPVLYKTII